MKTKIALVAALALLGCGDDKLPEYTLLDRLRILTLAANAPEVAAGSTVTITPYLSDATGGGRGLTFSAEACVDPGVNLGATPTCAANPTRTVLQSNVALAAPGVSPHFTGASTPFAVAVPNAATMFIDPLSGGTRSASEQYNGVAYLVLYTVTAANGDTATAFKRIVVSTRTTLNQNPVLTETQFAGVSDTTAAMPAATVALTAIVPASSTETYSYYTQSGTLANRSEELLISWFVNQGKLLRSRTDVGEGNEYTPQAVPLTTGTVFVVILRDDRGGATVRIVNK